MYSIIMQVLLLLLYHTDQFRQCCIEACVRGITYPAPTYQQNIDINSMSFGAKSGPPPLQKTIPRDNVQKHDSCDEAFGIFINSIARKVHNQQDKPLGTWRKVLPMLVYSIDNYDDGSMPEHILENVASIFNNLCKGSSASSREYRMYLAQLGCIEKLFQLLERSLNGHITAKLRFHCAQCLQYISIEEDLRTRVGAKSHISIILQVIYNINNGHSVKGELFGILMNLAANETNAKRILNEDGLHLIKQSLNCRPSEDISIGSYACGLVANIAAVQSLKMKVCRAGILTQLHKICKTQEDLLLLVNAVTAIKNVVHESSACAKMCAKTGGVAALRRAEKKIRANIETQNLVDDPTAWLPYLIDHIRVAKVASRKALIIANDYDDVKHPWRSLMSSHDNANAMQAVLERSGFDVLMLTNVSKKQLINSVKRFASILSPGDTCLIYFYGFGCRINGFNFLRPVEVPSFSRHSEIVSHLYSFENLINIIESRVGERGTKILLLECSQDKYSQKSMNRIKSNVMFGDNDSNNNDSNRSNTNSSVGPVNLTASEKNWYMLSSTADPIPAFDDDAPGQYSAFTHSLLCGIDEKALDISNFGKFVNRKFSTTIDNLKNVSIPMVASSMMRDFYFHGNINTRNKQAEDDQWEIDEERKREKTIRLQRYKGLRVLSVRKKSKIPKSSEMRASARYLKILNGGKPPSPPPGPPGNKKYNASPRVGMLYHGKNNGPLSKDAAIAYRPPVDYQNPYRETRKAPGEIQQLKLLASASGAHGTETNNTTHWLGTLRG
jgi:hypothetical protein